MTVRNTTGTGGAVDIDQPLAGPASDELDRPAVRLDGAALAVARSAAVDQAGDADLVGDAVDVYAEDTVAVTVRFQAMVSGYRGWLWSVTIALFDRLPSTHASGRAALDSSGETPTCTVSEVVLLPGPDALLAPAWVPWDQRVRSGDLGVGDLLPSAPDDPRLVPAYLLSDDPAVEEVSHELGIGRVRVMSREGRIDAAERWHAGSFGPDDPMAAHAPGHCATCGFYLPLAGSLGAGFGVCGNEYSPADGNVVDAAYGCGAHSEAIDVPHGHAAATDAVVDELQLDVHARPASAPDEPPAGEASEGASAGEASEGASADDGGDGDEDPTHPDPDGAADPDRRAE